LRDINEKEKEIDFAMAEEASNSHGSSIMSDASTRDKLFNKVPFMKAFCTNLDVIIGPRKSEEVE
jgi:hypothetical protein